MKRLAWLPILALTFACSGDGILRPDPAAAPDIAATVTPANGGQVLNAVMVLAESIDPGQLRITPGGVMHWKGFINALALSGDIEGVWYAGFSVVNDRIDEGQGPTPIASAWVEFTSMLGQPVNGGFECRGGGGLMDGYPGPALTHFFHVSSCKGWGDLQGKHMKVSGANRIGTWVYDATAVIW